MGELTEHLRSLNLFASLEETDLTSLAQIATIRHYQPGSIIFDEGDLGEIFHGVLEGRVKISKISPEGKEQILHLFGPGQMFGEAAVFTAGYYPATAHALEESTILQLPRQRLVEQIRKSPDLAFQLLATLSRRLNHFVTLIEDLSLKEVPARLGAYLLQLRPVESGPEPVVELEIPKGQLASLLGTIPETLSRILGKLTREGLLKAEGPRRLRLLDIDALEDLSAGRRRLR